MVNAIDLKEFDWIQSGEHQAIGIIAQQIQSFAPELISEDASDGHLKLNTDKLVYYCIKAIQELCEKEGIGTIYLFNVHDCFTNHCHCSYGVCGLVAEKSEERQGRK